MSAGLVEKVKGVKDRIQAVKDRILFFLEAIKEEQESLVVKTNDLANHLQALDHRFDSRLDSLEKQLAPINDAYSFPEDIEAFRRGNPEVALLQYLRSFLQTSNVLDIGANVGDVSAQLLSAGYRVWAFEPSPYAYEKLVKRLDGAPGFKHFSVAVGAKDGESSLYTVEVTDEKVRRSMDTDLTVYSTLVRHAMPQGLDFGTALEVKLRSLRSLHDSGELPGDVSIVKIDTEGGDLDVIRGMGNTKYAVIMTEFWDAAHYFSDGQFGLLSQTVLLLRNRGYPWHIVVYRVFDGKNGSEPRFYCNIDQSVHSSWGNAIFFRDYDVFREALKWCSVMLPANHSYGL